MLVRSAAEALSHGRSLRECRRTSLLSDAPPRMPELEPGRNRRVHCSSLVRRQIQKPKNPFFSGVGGGASHSNVSRATPTDQAEYTNRIGVDQRSGVTVPCV